MLNAFSNRLIAVYRFVSSILFVSTIAIVTLQVVGRYFFGKTPGWSEKLAMLFITTFVMLVGAIGVKENFHIGLDYFVQKFPDSLKNKVERLSTVLVAFFGLSMIYGGYKLMTNVWGHEMAAVGIPEAVSYLPLVLAGISIFCFSLQSLLSNRRLA